jgi:hypothetical protein
MASNEALAAVNRYQDFLFTGLGLPRDEVAKQAMVESNAHMINALREEIRLLEAELSRRQRLAGG